MELCTLKIKLLSSLLTIVLLTGCSSKKLLTSQDYEGSLHHHYKGSPEEALKSFPKKEKGAFITTLEKSYLNLLAGKPDLGPLLKLSDSIEKRIRYQGSREVKSLFYAETPEGYYASEHEIIWMHILLSWGFSQKGDYEKGCIAARQASHLLTAPWSHEGNFDDAMLRILLGSMWTMCGSWEDAVIDFRKALQLAPEYTWLKKLVNMDSPPKNLFIILGGVGPIPNWDPEVEFNPLRGMRHVNFKAQGEKNKLILINSQGVEIPLNLSPDSSYWYQRHFERDNSIHELLVDSHYTSQTSGTVVMESAKMAGSYAIGAAIIIGSVAVGAGIIYLSVLSGSGDLVAYGIVGGGMVALGGSMYGIDMMVETTDDSLESMEKAFNPSDKYRFVRFLPEYVWMGWNNMDYSQTHVFKTKSRQKDITIDRIENRTTVLIAHVPDVDLKKINLSLAFPVQIKWNVWRERLEKHLNDPSKHVQWDHLQQGLVSLFKLVKTSRYCLGTSISSKYHSLCVESGSIDGTIPSGLFEDSATYTIDLKNKKISADRRAMEPLIKIQPWTFIELIHRGINQEIENLKKLSKIR